MHRRHLSRRSALRLSLGLLPQGLNWPRLAWAETAEPRVVTLFQGATDTAVALGMTPVGVVESWSEKPTYRYLRSALSGVPIVGLETQPSLEDIVMLRPQAIIASRFRHQRISALLSRIAPVTMLDEIYQFKQTVLAMGQALQRQAAAQALLADWQRRVAQLQGRLQPPFGRRWPPTVAVLDIREDHIRSYLPASFPGSVLTELGFGWSEASRAQPGVSLKLTNLESLPVVDADIFFVFLRTERASAMRHYERVIAHPLWRQMRAPQRGQVWRVDGVTWSLSGGILGAQHILEDVERVMQGGVS